MKEDLEVLKMVEQEKQDPALQQEWEGSAKELEALLWA